MPHCYVLGGIGESGLSTSSAPEGTVWIDLTVLMLGQVGKLRLAADGISPGAPDGVALQPLGGIGPYCGYPTAILAVQLLGRGYSTMVFAWDWRKSVYAAGELLAARIRAEVTADDPCSLVGHSAGGLVCRAAWTELGLTGEHVLIRRIITLGTPHWGSYAAVRYWQGNSTSIDWLLYANLTLGGPTFGLAPDLFGYVARARVYYQVLAESWPSMYDLLPVIGAPDAAADPNRALLYDAANWPAAARPQQAWLDHSRDVTGPWLRSAASMPPPEVLTCVSGNTTTLPSAIVSANGFRAGDGLGLEVAADNAVTRDSAELAGSVVWRYGIDHENLLPDLANSGDLAGYVTAVREPGPAPTPEQSPQQQRTQIDPLPFSQSPGGHMTAPSCVGGVGCC
jgi:hypothetical protein